MQSRCEVRKLEYCVSARLVKRTDSYCLCTSLSDLWLCNNWWVNAPHDLSSGRADSFHLVSHICACEMGPRNWISIGSGNDWLPIRRQAITQSNPDILSIANLGIKFSEIRIKKPFHSWKRIWIYLLRNSVILSRGDELNLFHGPHTFACDCRYIWLT